MMLDGISVSWEAFVQSTFLISLWICSKENLLSSWVACSFINLILGWMSFITLNDVNYRIICFCWITKKTFIDNNTWVAKNIAKNIYKKCIKSFGNTFSVRNYLIFLGKCYFTTITRNFTWKKELYSFLKNFISSDVFNV